MSKLSLDIIHLINLINETGSFTSTADRLHKTPSAISYRASSVEKSLGIKLFNRNGPLVELTEAGCSIASEGGWILKAVNKLESSLNIKNKTSPTLRIGISESFPVKKFSQYFTDFMIKYPESRLVVQKLKDGIEWQYLIDHSVDFVISGRSCPSNVNVTTIPIGTNRLVCCATPEYMKLYMERNTKVKNQQDAWVVISNSNFDNIVKYSILCLKMNNRIIVDDLATQLELIKCGCGFGIVPLSSIREQLRNNEVVLSKTQSEIGYEIIWAGWTENNKSRYVRWWSDILRRDCIK